MVHLPRIEFMSYGCLFTDCHSGDRLHLPALIVFIINVIYCLDKTRQFDLSHFKLFANKSIPTEVCVLSTFVLRIISKLAITQ